MESVIDAGIVQPQFYAFLSLRGNGGIRSTTLHTLPQEIIETRRRIGLPGHAGHQIQPDGKTNARPHPGRPRARDSVAHQPSPADKHGTPDYRKKKAATTVVL